MVFQYDLCGTAERGADGGKLNQYLGTVTPVLNHALHALKMTDGAGKPVDYRLGLSMCMFVAVRMLVIVCMLRLDCVAVYMTVAVVMINHAVVGVFHFCLRKLFFFKL